MKKQIFVLGSSLLGLAMCAGVAAAAGPGEPVVEEPAVEAAPVTGGTVTETTVKEEDKAKPRGLYAGGTVGGSFFDGASRGSRIFSHETGDTNGDGRADAFTVDSIGDDSNFMWSAFVGYRLADWLGAEVGWTDIGGFSATDRNNPADVTDPPHNDKVKAKVDGIEARLRGWIPLGTDWVSGIGGVGIFVFSSHNPKFCNGPDISACTKAPAAFSRVPPALDPRHDSGQAFTISAGLQFRVTDNVLIRTEYQHFFEVLDQGVHLVTASVVVGFYDFFGQGKGGGGMGGVVIE